MICDANRRVDKITALRLFQTLRRATAVSCDCATGKLGKALKNKTNWLVHVKLFVRSDGRRKGGGGGIKVFEVNSKPIEVV